MRTILRHSAVLKFAECSWAVSCAAARIETAIGALKLLDIVLIIDFIMSIVVPSHEENLRRMLAGELYYAFTPELTALRQRCHHAVHRFNSAGEASRRRLVELMREYVPTCELHSDLM